MTSFSRRGSFIEKAKEKNRNKFIKDVMKKIQRDIDEIK